MTRNVVTIEPETSVADVAKIMTEKRFHGLPVVGDGKLLGVVAESDFFTKDAVSLHLPSYIDFIKKAKIGEAASGSQQKKIKTLVNMRAKDIMTSEFVTLSPEMEVGEAIKMFQEKKYNSFPVIDQAGNLVGIVALMDLLKLLNS